MYKKDLYNMEEPVRINHGLKQSLSYSHQPPYQDKQPYREYEHPPYGYDGGGYEPKPHNADSHLHYDNRVPHYNEQWPPYDQQTSSSQPYQPGPPPGPPPGPQPGHQQPLGYSPRSPYEDGPGRDYSPPQPRYDEAPPGGYEGRPRHAKPGPLRYDEPPPPAAYDARSPYDAEPPHGFPINSPRSPEPPKQYYGDSGLRPAYGPGPPGPQGRGYKPGMHEAEPAAPPPPPKPESLSSPGEPAVTPGSKPLPPPPREDLDEDPAMKPQSVLNRVKMFENKRSVSMDRAKEGESSALRVSPSRRHPGSFYCY